MCRACSDTVNFACPEEIGCSSHILVLPLGNVQRMATFAFWMIALAACIFDIDIARDIGGTAADGAAQCDAGDLHAFCRSAHIYGDVSLGPVPECIVGIGSQCISRWCQAAGIPVDR